MPRRVNAENAREALVTKLAQGEHAPTSDARPEVAEPTARQKHKELVRAAGRAALEESLQSGPGGVKRKASEMTAAGIAAQWQAYAEVYGTNGMAAGGARSSLVGAEPDASEEVACTSVGNAEPAAESADASAAAVPTTVAGEAPGVSSADTAADDDRPVRKLAIWDF